MIRKWNRLFSHFTIRRSKGVWPQNLFWWFLEFIFLLFDALGLPDLLMLLDRVFKPRKQPLSKRQLALAKTIFRENINYPRVWLDSGAHLGPRQYGFAYVGFYTIKSWGALSDAVLIHELVHVWQYEKFGAVYIPRALWAQHFGGGYDYGGAEALRKVHLNGGDLLDFNFEQMGEVVADYYRLKNGYKPRYCAADPLLLPVMKGILERSFKGGN